MKLQLHVNERTAESLERLRAAVEVLAFSVAVLAVILWHTLHGKE